MSAKGDRRSGGRTRSATLARKTKETDIQIELDLDGSGQYEVATGIPFFDHMLESFAKHGLFDLRLQAAGDVEVDLPVRCGRGWLGPSTPCPFPFRLTARRRRRCLQRVRSSRA